MALPSPPPELPVKKETVSFAPPPPELNLPRITLNSSTAIDDQPREHPDSSYRRSSLSDSSGRKRLMSSPPPPPAYSPRVSFDTFDTQDATTFALTLRSKHRMYRYNHTSRTFLLGLDNKDYSQYALEWGMKELFEDNDEIVILRVIDSAEKAQLEPDGQKQEKAYQVEAKRLLDTVISQNKGEKALNFIVELVVGRFQDQVQRMIEIYSPDSLIVGTRGRDGAIGGLLPGSIYCLQHSPVPVIVVHPSQRRLHRKHKREKDPDRQSYINLLKQTKEYDSSSESFVPSPDANDSGVALINFDTPDTLSPDDMESAPTVTKPRIQIDAVVEVATPSTDAEPAAPLEGQGEKVSPAEKG